MTQPRVAECQAPIQAEERSIEDQLNQAKALNVEIIVNRALIDDLEQARTNLLGSFDDGQMSPQEKLRIDVEPAKLVDAYTAMASDITARLVAL